MTLSLACLVLLAAAYLTIRGWDVRLVLITAGLLLGLMVGQPQVIVRAFFNTFSDEKYVIPICSAMGFAYVLKHTGCDQHLVLLLMKPIRRIRFLLVPGVVTVGFLVNIPVLSQTSVAVCLGAVVVPLMRGAGFHPLTIGSALLLGASVGGELFNPGAPELNSVMEKTGTTQMDLARRHLPWVVVPMFVVSTVVFWIQSVWLERRNPAPPTAPVAIPTEPLNIFKALVPVVPLVLLFLSGPPLKVLDIPPEWLAIEKDVKNLDKVLAGRLVGLAMLIGMVVAAIASPGKAGGCIKAYFEGAGYAFTQVVSLIVAAVVFGKGLEVVGLAAQLGQLMNTFPQALVPLAIFVPWLFAMLSGSGMASTASLFGTFHQPAVDAGLNPDDVGALVSVGSAAGRTMSPVAAVSLMCSKLTDTTPWQLVARVAGPLLVGLVTVLVLRLCRVV
jgi:C4-dicarboxylate transporter, DcuC family